MRKGTGCSAAGRIGWGVGIGVGRGIRWGVSGCSGRGVRRGVRRRGGAWGWRALFAHAHKQGVITAGSAALHRVHHDYYRSLIRDIEAVGRAGRRWSAVRNVILADTCRAEAIEIGNRHDGASLGAIGRDKLYGDALVSATVVREGIAVVGTRRTVS